MYEHVTVTGLMVIGSIMITTDNSMAFYLDLHVTLPIAMSTHLVLYNICFFSPPKFILQHVLVMFGIIVS